MGMIVVGEECKDCIQSTIDDTDKSKILVYCGAKDKTYYYGQYIPCELKIKKR